MKAITAYFAGWKQIFANKRMWILLYLLNLGIALIAAFPISGIFSKSLGQSLELTRSLNGFDYSFINELLREYQTGFNIILQQSVGFTILYLLIFIFLMGGILSVFKDHTSSFSFSNFWKACGKYFWRLLRLSIYFLIIQGILLAIFASLYMSLTNGMSPFKNFSEATLITTFQILAPIYIILAIIVFMIHDYAKIHVVHEDKSIISFPILQTFALVFKNFFSCFGLYLLNILSLLILTGIYWLASSNMQGTSMSSICILFITIQLFIFTRLGLKLLNLASANHLYKAQLNSNEQAIDSNEV